MAEQRPCTICSNQAEYSKQGVPRWSAVERCPRRGEFEYDQSAGLPGIRSPDDIVRLSGWVREQNAAGVIPVEMTR